MDLTNLNKEKRNRRKPSIDLSTMVYGKVPPQAKELEEAVLGACMLEGNNRALNQIADILQPECFYVDAHQRVFKVLLFLAQKGETPDILTVVEELKRREELDMVGGPHGITVLTNKVVSTANIEVHARIIFQKFLSREIIRIGGEMIGDAYEDSTDVFDLLDQTESKISTLTINRINKVYKSISDLVTGAVDLIITRKESKQELTGVPTGIRTLDLVTQGWQPTNFIVIAARPAIGKSAVAGNLAVGAASNNQKPTPVAIFSLEMGAIQWVLRMLSAESEINFSDMLRGRVTDQDLQRIYAKGVTKLHDLPIFFDDSANLNLQQFKSKARTLVMNEKVGLIILDYLQLMSGNRQSNENREQEIARISRECKQLAKELNIPIIALSQVGRQGENGDLKLSSLRESGAIEQDADDVIFLIPPDEKEIEADASLRDNLLLKVAKHRNGRTTELTVKYIKDIQKVISESEYDDYLKRTGVLPEVPYTNGNSPAIKEAAKLFIQKGSKMSNGNFDEGIDPADDF